ncbi:MAG: sugar ABC transporter substrate-binding protein [Christensenellales bacterium]
MKRTKRTLFVVMLLIIIMVVGSVLVSCGSKEAPAKKLKWGFSLSNMKQDRWAREQKMFQAFCDEKGIELTTLVADDDTNKQYSQCESMISSGVDAIFLRPIDSTAAGTIAKMVHDAGKIYVAYDVLTFNGPVEYFVTFDSLLVGKLQAEELLKQVPKGGNVVMINGNPASDNAQMFYKGAKEVLDAAVARGDIKIVADQWCQNYSTEQALAHTENALTANKNNIQGILCATDTLAGSVLSALEAQGLMGKVPVTGQDAELAACQRIVEGKQLMTIYKPITVLNRAACEIVYAALTGADVDKAPSRGVWTTYNNKTMDVKTFKCEVIAVTKDNMMKTVIADGFQKYEDVYKNVPEAERPPKA